MLSFSIFKSSYRDFLLIISVNAASCIISSGVRVYFYNKFYQLAYCVATDKN